MQASTRISLEIEGFPPDVLRLMREGAPEAGLTAGTDGRLRGVLDALQLPAVAARLAATARQVSVDWQLEPPTYHLRPPVEGEGGFGPFHVREGARAYLSILLGVPAE